ncbi:SH2 domain-containing protein 3C isoform X1 [Arapaima gigas]
MKKQKLGFKWFGSISGLSLRKSAHKAKSKGAPEHRGRPSRASLEEGSADDMEAGSRSPTYACSSDAASHLVTLPRRSLKQKGSRGSKKVKGEDESQRPQAADDVRDSPLLAALSSGWVLGLNLDAGQNTGSTESETPTESVQDPLPTHRRDSREREQLDPEGTNLLGSDPTSRLFPALPSSPPQTTTARATEEPEPPSSHLDSMDSRGEYVKFSKDKYREDVPPEKLRNELEEELALHVGRIQGQGWYHGHMPREVAETLVVRNGDFLIRDSLTSAGDYVLTSRWNNKALHFVVGKVLVETGNSNPQFQYRLGRESFDSVAALVHFYVGSRQPLSVESGAHIYCPINRTLPLHRLEATFTVVQGNQGSARSPSSPRRAFIRVHNVTIWVSLSVFWSAPVDPHHGSPSDGRFLGVVPPIPVLHRSGELCPPSTCNSPPSEACKFCPLPVFAPLSEGYAGHLHVKRKQEERSRVFVAPTTEMSSAFKPGQYRSPLMPAENKPLDAGILKRVKELLAEVDSRTAAQHLTKVDCMVARILDSSPEMQKTMAVDSGLELLTLPHGHQLRMDLLERFHTMSIMIAAELLGCTGSREERASLLHKIILLAAELKSSMGNMFGFAAIMRALALPQILRLEQMWVMLRQRHTESAILYEKKLKPYLNTINAEGCVSPDAAFPHVVPLLLLLERGVDMMDEVEPWEKVDVGVEVVMNHLEAARVIAHEEEKYRSYAQSKLQEFRERPEVLEVFLTEFQMRLLWGSRGAEASQAERYVKFDRVLTALSNKLEPPGELSVERT